MTIRKRGAITSTPAAHAALGSPRAVELLHDDNQRRIGLRVCDSEMAQAGFARPAGRPPGGPFVVAAVEFLRRIGVDTTEARRLPVHVDAGVLCIDLDGGSPAIRA